MYAVEISYYHKCHYLLSVQQAESDYFCGVFSIGVYIWTSLVFSNVI